MSGIVDDIIEDVQIKPSKFKKVLKWILSIAILLITAAFIVGEFKSQYINKISNIEGNVETNKTDINNVKTDMKTGFTSIDTKIDVMDSKIDKLSGSVDVLINKK